MKTTDVSLLLLRLAGLTMALWHGQSKLASLVTGEGDRLIESAGSLGFPMPVVFAWAAALSEFVGGLLIALGLGTRIASGFLAFTMAVAALGRHRAFEQMLAGLGLKDVDAETLQKWGKPESALVYLVVFIALILMGPGRYSLDHVLAKRFRRGTG